jgi:hypothetical protein
VPSQQSACIIVCRSLARRRQPIRGAGHGAPIPRISHEINCASGRPDSRMPQHPPEASRRPKKPRQASWDIIGGVVDPDWIGVLHAARLVQLAWTMQAPVSLAPPVVMNYSIWNTRASAFVGPLRLAGVRSVTIPRLIDHRRPVGDRQHRRPPPAAATRTQARIVTRRPDAPPPIHLGHIPPPTADTDSRLRRCAGGAAGSLSRPNTHAMIWLIKKSI